MRSAVLAIGLLAASSASAKTYTVVPAKAKVEWIAVGNPGFLEIEGRGGQLSGSAEEAGGKISGKFTVDLRSYKTGMALRDRHMHEKYLESDKFPEAVLTLTDLPTGKPDIPFVGELYIKGIKKPVKGDASFKDGKLTADFKVNIEEYPAIGVPSYLGVTVAKEVKVHVEAALAESGT